MIEVEIEADAWTGDLATAEAVAVQAAEAALAHEGRTGAGIVILMTDDEALADLNQRFRGKAGPTNVLSFPAAPNPEGLLGDIALAHGVCAREAAVQGKTLEQHLAHLTAHGVLHLLGYDHEDDGEAEAMEALERSILESLGVPDPYLAERS